MIRLISLVLAAGLGLAACLAASAIASGSGSVTATITVAPPPTVSVSVSPSTFTYGPCLQRNSSTSAGSDLTFPNGVCESSGVTVTNGAAPAQINVNGSSAIPSDGNLMEAWALCGGSATGSVACTGGNLEPGQNQYREQASHIGGTSGSGVTLTDSAQCDVAFGASGSCQAAAGEEQSEALELFGPESAIDTSSKFETAITWMAVAP